MFTLVIAPMMMFGCAYYPWSALSSFRALQIAVLVNPLVYASEGLRGTLAPQFPHMPVAVVLTVLALADLGVLALGLHRFDSKAVN
jgi:ABC-2 type transport system permease protein